MLDDISQQTPPISIKESSSLNTEETVIQKSDEMWIEELIEYRKLYKLLKNEDLL